MRAVVQRVSEARVIVDGATVGEIGLGLCVLLGVGEGDGEKDAEWLAEKMVNLRIFEDDAGKMNRSLLDVQGAALIISQFTLYGDCRKGRRPSFIGAAAPEEGERLYEYCVRQVESLGVETACGVFGAHMQVELINDGPVTLLLDTRKEA
ncbi:MAG: D-tyrosyl-tRNA(Tyr) deacylase [Fretibacterium sp.]|nr:D-tyrosyl-tRNA(Tyr) deacylase [Fretibacterium sp.]